MLAKPRMLKAGVRDVDFGVGVTVVEPVNLYECEIDEGSFVGPFVEIQKGAKIGKFTKIQSHSFVCDLVTIGDHCFVGHGVMFINDLFRSGKPAGGETSLWDRTIVGDHVSIGSNATVLPVSICNNVVIGAGAVVTKDILKPGVYVGNPARLIREFPTETHA